jgi:glycosyltransferase involved in cell wall biosynthesis
MNSRVAIACSGVGHVARGNETWAHGLAEALHAAGEPVTLFGHGPLKVRCPYSRIATVRRDHWLWRRWAAWGRRYAWEQSLFALILSRRLRAAGCDIVHTGDPQIAWGLHKRRRQTGCAVIYKDGLLLGPVWNRNFEHVQVLAPHYLAEAQRDGVNTVGWRVIPHFTDPEKFTPAPDPQAARQAILGDAVPHDALVVLAAGALARQSNKRLDWIARELTGLPEAHLLVVGQAETADRTAFEQELRPLLGARLHLRTNAAPADMPRFYQAADLFAHAALREPFGIVFIEALASGLPVLGHRFPVTGWIIGDGGVALDMEAPGALTAALRELAANPVRRRELGLQARMRALAAFSPTAVLPLYRKLYAAIRDERARHGAAPA